MPDQELPQDFAIRSLPGRYNAVARFLHWTIALLILVQVPLGLISANIGPKSPDPGLAALRETILFWHKSLGLTVLALALIRIGWVLWKSRPPLPGHLPRAERLAAKTVHYLLYGLMIGLPLTGILLSQGVGFPISFFGLFNLPDLVHPDLATPLFQRPAVLVGVILHKRVLAYALYVILALHILGLLKHQVIDRDPSIWRRMAPGQAPRGPYP